MSDDGLTIGYVAGAHGIRGALKVRLHDPASQAVHEGVSIELRRDGAHVGAFEVVECAKGSGQAADLRVMLAGVRDRDAAEALRGCEVRIDRAHLPPLADDEYYLADLVGSRVERVREGGEPEHVGDVVAITSNGPQDLLEIEWTSPMGQRERWLLPALPGFVLDVTPGRVLADVPPGFLPEALEGPQEEP